MKGFRTFLNDTVTAVKQGDFGPTDSHTKRLRIVMGNTSCDMDSAIGALALAYYYTVKSEGKEVWVPVINSSKKDFFCNLEIV